MLKFGNHKLDKKIAIFNMGTAQDCPSKKLGLCATVNKGINCYARNPEIQYKEHVLNYRNRQNEFWRTHTEQEIIDYFSSIISRKRTKTTYFRYNEASDFHTQQDISKLSGISKALKDKYNIITYGYTARSDLDFSNVNFIVRGSDFKCNNGKTIVLKRGESWPDGYKLCPGVSCGNKCLNCMQESEVNIAFRKH